MKLVVFLGSGISVPSGLPRVEDLTNLIVTSPYHYNRDGQLVCGADSNAAFRQTDRTVAIQNFLQYISDYDAAGTRGFAFRNDKPTYEDLFSLCAAITLFHNGLADNSITTSFVESMERFARPLLKGEDVEARISNLGSLASEASRFIEDVVVGALQKDTVTGLSLIVELARVSFVEQLNIFTLNHDTLVEQYLSQEGVDFVDGFGAPDGDVRWYDERLYQSALNKVNLFKLHGSVNWRIFISNPNPAMFVGEDIEDVRNGGNMQLKLSHRSPWFLTGVNKANFYQRGIYADCHFRFHQMLRESPLVVMSGYGWADTAINWKFDTWLDQDQRNSIVLLHRRPKEITDRSLIVARAYDHWVESRQLVRIPKWLDETSLYDIEDLLHQASLWKR